MFFPYNGYVGELPMNENYLAFKWDKPGTHVLFSACQQGKGIRSHFTADKKSLRYMKKALNEWNDFCFELFKDSDVLYAIIPKERKGIIRLAKACGYKILTEFKGIQVLIKEKPCHS